MEPIEIIRQALANQKRVRGKEQLVHLLAGEIMAVVALADSSQVVKELAFGSDQDRAAVLGSLAQRTDQIVSDLAMGSGPLEPTRKVMILADQAWHLCDLAEASANLRPGQRRESLMGSQDDSVVA